MGDAKAGLKRALEKANSLEKENFKVLKYWLKNDEDISANAVMFFERMRKEIKRSLKVLWTRSSTQRAWEPEEETIQPLECTHPSQQQ